MNNEIVVGFLEISGDHGWKVRQYSNRLPGTT